MRRDKSLENLKAEKWLLELYIKDAEESQVIPPEVNPQLPYMRESLVEVIRLINEQERKDAA